MVKLQNTLTIDLPEGITFDYDYGSQDNSKPSQLHLTGAVPALISLFESGLKVLEPHYINLDGS